MKHTKQDHAEIERLTALNAEMVAALEGLLAANRVDHCVDAVNIARAALAKVKDEA